MSVPKVIDPKNVRVPSVKLPAVDPKKDVKTTPALLPNTRTLDDKSRFEPSRIRRTGVPDDSVGRASGKKNGVPDDSVGRAERNDLFAPHDSADQLALRAALFERLETPSYLDTSAHRAFTDAAAVDRGLKANTNATQAAALLAAAKKTPEIGARLQNLFAATAGLRADVTHSLLQTFATDAGGAAGSVVEHVVTSAWFRGLTVAQQTDAAAVMARLSEKGLVHFGALVEKAPKAFADADALGQTLLTNLARLATQPLSARLAGKTSAEAILSGIVRDVANPNRVDQGTAPTCTVTSMQFELVSDNPAEYARLMAGLTGPSGSVRMRGGSALTVGATDADAAARDGRSVSQAIFQSAAMEYANGRFAEFDPVAGGSTNKKTGATFRGLKPHMQKAVLEQLFGIKYSTDQMATEAEGQRMLEKLRGFDARKQPNRPIILDIDQGNINHAVTLERITQGRIYFRDPYGSLRSMPDTMFSKYVMAVHLPK